MVKTFGRKLICIYTFLAATSAVYGNPITGMLKDLVEGTFEAAQVGEVDEEAIAETPVQYAGEISLALKGEIDLKFDETTPGIGTIRWVEATPDYSLLLTEQVSGEAHEFSLRDGSYIRAFGRNGKGPGEYGFADKISIAPAGDVYIYDFTYLNILRYDRSGEYVGQWRQPGGLRLTVGRDDALFLLSKNRNNTAQLQRLIGADWEVEYAVPLSGKDSRFAVCLHSYANQLVYNPASNRIYYTGPNDYTIKEVDAATGKIMRKFGTADWAAQYWMRYEKDATGEWEIDYRQHGVDYHPLPSKYRSESCDSSRRYGNEVEQGITVAQDMVLLEERYLLVSYQTPLHWSPIIKAWIVYDLGNQDTIRSYSFDGHAHNALLAPVMLNDGGVIVNTSSGNKTIAAHKDELHIYSSPAPEEAETSNGRIQTYTLSFDQSLARIADESGLINQKEH